VAMGSRDDDTVLSLANRLVRLNKMLDDKARTRIEKASGGTGIGGLGKALISALDPDAIVQDALAAAKAKSFTRSEDTLLPEELEAARAKRLAAACAPFDKPELRDEIETARREREQIIDHVNLDEVTFSGFSEAAEGEARAVIQKFTDFLKLHKDEIAALSFFYQQPYQRRALTFEMIEELHDALSRPPLMLTTERLWSAYARVHANQVKGATSRRQLTDLVSLLRFALGLEHH
jgi:type I restriction enzyme, R subunit